MTCSARWGQGSWRPGNDTRPWVRFTLTARMRQARTMLVRVREAKRLWVPLDQLTERCALSELLRLRQEIVAARDPRDDSDPFAN